MLKKLNKRVRIWFGLDKEGWAYKRFRCGHVERVWWCDVTDLMLAGYCSHCAEEMAGV